ncbi:MAG TPA: DUF305 domain-containing protein [Candidatus Saccharimonadales bacterium]|nr:DUF305 domain-containing protein [Candidatus Saccharimonadales bacterium]
MKKESILYAIVGLLGGVVIAGFTAAYAVNNNNTGIMRMMGMDTQTDNQGMMNNEDMSMSEMSSLLSNKTGDDFDKAFIAQMISHHEGAIDMALLAKQNAEHDEIKKLADDIVTAQSKEIDMMQTWQADWGYKSVPQSHSMDMMR